MVTIYCIEDILDKKYVGSTKQKLYKRFSAHKRINNNCSSKLLNIHNSIIYSLEECEESERHEREKYWINKLDTVNLCKLDSHDRPSINIRRKRYYDKHKDKINEKRRLKYLEKKSKCNHND